MNIQRLQIFTDNSYILFRQFRIVATVEDYDGRFFQTSTMADPANPRCLATYMRESLLIAINLGFD